MLQALYLNFARGKHHTVLTEKKFVRVLCSRKMATTSHIVYAILKFLDDQQRSPDLTPDAIESLEGNCTSLLFNCRATNVPFLMAVVKRHQYLQKLLFGCIHCT